MTMKLKKNFILGILIVLAGTGLFLNFFDTRVKIDVKMNPSNPRVSTDYFGEIKYSTYLAGESNERARDVTFDDSGNMYVVGYTESSTAFPITEGAMNESNNGWADTFVMKFNPSGNLVFSTYLGGSKHDYGLKIAVDANYIYVAGGTMSSNFPVTDGVYDTTYNANLDVFVCKMTLDGSRIVYATYLGGDGDDLVEHYPAFDMYVKDGKVFLTGRTKSTDFPTSVGAYSDAKVSLYDCFVSVLSSNLSSLLASTYIGGSELDTSVGIGVGGDDDIFIAGWTESSDFPVNDTAFEDEFNGGHSTSRTDGFITRFNNSLSGIVYSTYFGSFVDDKINDLIVDENSRAYVCGWTDDDVFPVTGNAYMRVLDRAFSTTGFISVLESNGRDLYYSTFYGTDDFIDEEIVSLNFDRTGNILFTGLTSDNSDFPFFPSNNNASDHMAVFTGCFNISVPASEQLMYCGSFNSQVNGMMEAWEVAASPVDNDIGFVGYVYNAGYPVTGDAINDTVNALGDGFITKINIESEIAYTGMSSFPGSFFAFDNYDISWTVNDFSLRPDDSRYEIYRGNSRVKTGTWNLDGTINLSVSRMKPGIYTYSIIVYDGAGQTQFHSTNVNVTSYPSSDWLILFGGIIFPLVGLGILLYYVIQKNKEKITRYIMNVGRGDRIVEVKVPEGEEEYYRAVERETR